ncbi:MAG: hypothetical protein IPK16_19120 [Anaerolineales bacterium]|nr:hypothetical protein [Anaerolineales bacterium]
MRTPIATIAGAAELLEEQPNSALATRGVDA